MNEPKKYGFSNDFSTGGSSNPFVERRKNPSVPLEEHQEALSQAEAQGFMRGHGAGVEAARLEQNARLSFAIEQLNDILSKHQRQLAQIEHQANTESLNFALAFSQILAGTLIAAHPLATIEAVARHVFDDLRGVPHIAVRVSTNLVTPVTDMLNKIAKNVGMTAKIIVLGEPEIEVSDCRIEWADGGIISDQKALHLQIKSAVTDALAEAQIYNSTQKDFIS